MKKKDHKIRGLSSITKIWSDFSPYRIQNSSKRFKSNICMCVRERERSRSRKKETKKREEEEEEEDEE